MNTKQNILKNLIYFALGLALLWSCNADREDFQGEKYESINSGTLTVHCEESLYKLLDSAFKLYQTAYPKIQLKVEIVHSRKAMALLLSGETEAVITARSFLTDEDSLMKAYDVKRHEMIAASDALVFYVNKNFPLDTLNHEQLVNVLSNRVNLKDIYPQLLTEPEFVCNSTNSSEFANVQKLVLKDKLLNKYFRTFNTCDSVQKYILSNSSAIGIGYLSQIYGNPELKALEIGYINDKGNRVFPQTVHQGFIVQGKYPYINKIRVFLKDDRMNKPFWFASFMSKEAVVQKYLKDMGIVPEYARFKLTKE